jgi:hypothetical protein
VVEGDPVHVVVSGLRPAHTVRLRVTRSWSAYPRDLLHSQHTAARKRKPDGPRRPR